MMQNVIKLICILSSERNAIKVVFNICDFWIMIPLDDNKNGPFRIEPQRKLAASDEVDFVVYLQDLGVVEYT